MHPMPRLALLLLLLLPAPLADATDLGPGNQALAKRFEAYKKGGHRSKKSTARHRVMITGFGLFSGVDYNISGVVVDSMANEKFWPKLHGATVQYAPPKASEVGSGKLSERDGGARVRQRLLTINDLEVEVCFLVLDVLWDLGAAITLYEAQNFRPQLIIMTGRGGRTAVFESGALNRAAGHPGFRASGDPDRRNQPVTPYVLDPSHEGIESAIAMPWDNEALAKMAREVLAGLDPPHEVVAAPAARKGNTYICNNISAVVLHALKGVEVRLAGGHIKLRSDLEGVKGGFLHYPAKATNRPVEVWRWCEVLAGVITRELPGRPSKRGR